MSADAIGGLIDRIVRAVMRGVDYYALYRARVVAQSADLLKLDVQPDDARIPGMSGIELRLGIPGFKVKVAAGQHCLVGWDAGRPSLPYALLWDAGSSATEIYADASTKIVFQGGTAKVSRVGDKTTGHDHSATFALTAPSGGGPVTGTITIASNTDTMAEGADKVLA